MSVTAVAALLLVIMLLALIWVKLSGHALDPLALFTYLFFFFYVFRDTLITFGWDGPYPDALFVPSQTPALVARLSMTLALFLVAFVGGYLAYQAVGPGLSGFVHSTWSVPPLWRQVRLSSWLTIAATLVSLALLARYGGVKGVVRAGKVTHSLAGSYELRIFPSVGAVACAALFLTLRQVRRETGLRRPTLTLLALLGALLNSAYVLLWGSRTVVAITLAIFIAGQWLLGHTRTVRSAGGQVAVRRRQPQLVKVLFLAAVLLASVFVLRLVRDTIVFPNGRVSGTIAGQSALRQISVATNSNYFDASLLAVRDWPSLYPYRHGEDFLIGLEGVVPRAAWANKPENVRPGAWFRQIYEPWATNGWPLGAVGDWYLNLGFLGVAIGGLLSGVFYTALMAAWRRAPWTPFTLASIMCVVVFVVPTGIEALTPLRWAQWALPLLLCGRYLSQPTRRTSAEASYGTASLKPGGAGGAS
jgi:hypothetical protein